MADTHGGGRRYTDRETALILKLASELDAATPPGEGHSLSEIQEIAAEAGIDGDLVLQAARALEVRRTPGAALAGAPTTFEFQRTLDGELADPALGALLSTIRRVTGQEGEAARLLDVLEWRATSAGGGTTHVEVSRRGGRTGLRVKGTYENVAAWPYLWAGILAAVVSVVAGTEIQATVLVEAGVIAGIWGSCYLGARAIWRRMARRLEGRLHSLLETVSAQAAQALASSPQDPGRLPEN